MILLLFLVFLFIYIPTIYIITECSGDDQTNLLNVTTTSPDSNVPVTTYVAELSQIPVPIVTPAPTAILGASGIPKVAYTNKATAPVHIDVGGTIYTSSLETLTRYV